MESAFPKLLYKKLVLGIIPWKGAALRENWKHHFYLHFTRSLKRAWTLKEGTVISIHERPSNESSSAEAWTFLFYYKWCFPVSTYKMIGAINCCSLSSVNSIERAWAYIEFMFFWNVRGFSEDITRATALWFWGMKWSVPI